MNKSMYWAGGTITQIEICRVILRYNNLAVHPLWDMLNLNEFKKKKKPYTMFSNHVIGGSITLRQFSRYKINVCLWELEHYSTGETGNAGVRSKKVSKNDVIS